ncbi:MAG: TetR/AcrR family transcriptional regulator [Chlamydiia bacterium]|nr:TetR/AcrR family transcriptional regulator [Chlamydiia bacterium]MCP5491593.1 TetR/AcrR family transcriptional regulator [Chlamydiales bacterium]
MAKLINRRKEILQVARNLFLTKDYDQTTMSEIMDALKIAKGTIYHYFRSKEALFEAVIEDIVEKNIEQMEALIKNSPESALKKIELLASAGNISQENERIVKQLHKPANDALHSRLLAATLMKQAPLYAKIIEQGCKEGAFKTQAPLESAEFLLSAVQFLTDMGIYPWTEETLARRIKAFPRLIEQLLQATPGSFQFLVNHMQGY